MTSHPNTGCVGILEHVFRSYGAPDFPLGVKCIPTAEELDALAKTHRKLTIGIHEVEALRCLLDLRLAYNAVIFSLRMAVLGVRTHSPEPLRFGLVGLFLDNDMVDWRDMLGALAIAEYCASRVGTELRAEILGVTALATPRRQRTIESYFSRPAEMRTPEVMGFRPLRGNDELFFQQKMG
jgi:hypothetical protein